MSGSDAHTYPYQLPWLAATVGAFRGPITDLCLELNPILAATFKGTKGGLPGTTVVVDATHMGFTLGWKGDIVQIGSTFFKLAGNC